MVVGEKDGMKGAGTQAQQIVPPPPSSIENILSGISNTGAVKMNNHRKKLRQRFDIIKKLGQGTYGKVQLGINKETGQEVAIKTIKKCKIETEADLIRIRREVQIMSSVQHPNIIHIYEVFENREKMVLVMEFAAGGELYDYLSERKVLSEEEARRIFRQIATAVYYCHKHKICHRDLKLENILLDENGNAKIADFGLSNVFDDQRLLATFCGSPLYASPEIVKGTPYQGPEVDCWSLGVLLYTLVYGAMPFDGSNFKRLVKQISAGDYYEPKKPSNASPLIREMLTVCPKRRATIEQICSHWWVNETYNESCLDVAEELANQTPVRLDVLLSLSPAAITSDKLVVPDPNEENKQTVARSMSVGSIRDIQDIANTEAEQRIIDMVAAGGEAALAPSPTRNIVPAESALTQPKRKPETTISTDMVAEDTAAGARKREKPSEQLKTTPSKCSISEVMDTAGEGDGDASEKGVENNVEDFASNMLPEVVAKNQSEKDAGKQRAGRKKSTKKDVDTIIEEVSPSPLQSSATGPVQPKSPVKKYTKTKTTELGESAKSSPEKELKEPLADDKPSTERRKSRILETAEKFQGAAAGNDKPKKINIPGVSVDSHKKEFERKASLTSTIPSTMVPPEKRHIINSDSIDEEAPITGSRKASGIAGADIEGIQEVSEEHAPATDANDEEQKLSESDSKSSNLSLEEARRSMENSIALLNQAKTESNSDVDQLCAKTENVAVTNDDNERQKKLKNAREIIGNAIPRLSGIGVRKPPVPFGLNGRSISGSVVPSSTAGPGFSRNNTTPPDPRMYERETPMSIYSKPLPVAAATSPLATPNDEDQPIKVSHAEITLKSNTLPRRKASHADNFKFGMGKDATPTKAEPRYQGTTQYQSPYSPVYQHTINRATSLEPQQQNRPKEHIIPIQRPGGSYMTNTGATSSQRSFGAPLSRQSTNESESSDTQTSTTGQSSATLTSQPIKKSPREFIIPIAIEGGGFITPRAGSLEPSDSNNSTSTSFSRFSGRPKKFSSIFNDKDSEDESSPFHRMHRHTSIGRDSDTEDPASKFNFTLRSTRPIKKLQSTDTNDSGSSGEEDDEDGFEILTAENLFSTLLSRVRALTNRLNVKDDPTSNFPTSQFMNKFRQSHSPFWQHDPFSSRLNSSGAWRHSMTRDLGTDIDSMFSSRTGATLPRGVKSNPTKSRSSASQQFGNENDNTSNKIHHSNSHNHNLSMSNNDTSQSSKKSYKQYDRANSDSIANDKMEKLDLADLDLSQLRLTKKDLETLSNITPELPKHFQEQLLAQLPPNQARKLSRTLSMQGSNAPHVYKRSLSGGRDIPAAHDEEVENHEAKENESKQKSESRQINTPNQTATLDFDRNSILRRSLSRSHDSSNRSSTRDSANRFSYANDLGSDQLSKPNDQLASRYRLNNYSSSIPLSVRNDYYSRLPSAGNGCLSPPPPLPRSSSSCEAIESPVKHRSSQRRISRFLRPDFYDSSTNLATPTGEDTDYARSRREKERETQDVLREIRERSRDRTKRNSASYLRDSSLLQHANTEKAIPNSRDTNGEPTSTSKEHRKSSIPNIRITVDKQTGKIYHARNNSVERCCDFDDSIAQPEDIKQKRGSISMSSSNKMASSPNVNQSISSHENSLNEFTDQILNELIKQSQQQSDQNNQIDVNTTKKSKTKIKDGRKSSSRQKSVEDALTNANNSEMVAALTNEIESVTISLPNTISKIARPKSYPNKEEKQQVKSDIAENIPKDPTLEQNHIATPNKSENETRPKSYPNSKLTPPKEVGLSGNKKLATPTQNGTKNAITAAMEKFIEKSAERLSPVKSIASKKSKDETQQSEVKEADEPKTVKKKIKIVKKKTDQPSPTKESSPQKTAKGNQSTTLTAKDKLEKSPEKKLIRSGFLNSIAQKFEKMRENSKNKEKKITKVSEKNSTKEEKPKAVEKEEKVNENTINVIKVNMKIPTPNASVAETSSVPIETPKETDVSSKIDSRNHTKIGQLGTKQLIVKNEASVQDEKPEKDRSDRSDRTDRSDKSDKSDSYLEGRRSRIDAMIRHLRERSEPYNRRMEDDDLNSIYTESGLIKRAVSVEDVSNDSPTFNKCNVNKVLGLFQRIEQEQQQQLLKDRLMYSMLGNNNSGSKERPRSSGFINKLKKSGKPYYTGAKSDTIITLTDQLEKQLLAAKINEALNRNSKVSDPATKIPALKATLNLKLPSSYCPDCGTTDCQDITSLDDDVKASVAESKSMQQNGRHSRSTKANTSTFDSQSEKERIKNNRKGLILDLNNDSEYDVTFNLKLKNNPNTSNPNSNNENAQYQHTNRFTDSNNINSNGNINNGNRYSFGNGNIYPNYSDNKNDKTAPVTPTYETYSSDSRSLRDDCESTSTFLTPSEEPELCFDDWSQCSGSNDDRVSPHSATKYTLHIPSRNSLHQRSLDNTPTTVNNLSPSMIPTTPIATDASNTASNSSNPSDNESVIDRIKRRSFYTRFNEKKPKRSSSIVGPGARDYYRDMASRSKSRPHESNTSESADSINNNYRNFSKSPTPMNSSRADLSGATSPVSFITTSATASEDNEETTKYPHHHHHHHHYHYHTPTARSAKSNRYDEENDDDSPYRKKSNEFLNLRSTLTSPPAHKYYSHTLVSPTSVSPDYTVNGTHSHRPYSVRNSYYDSLTPSASSSSTTSSSPYIYGSYNPKRRMSSYISPTLTTSLTVNGSTPDGFNTIGRRNKPYDHRSISLLDSKTMPSPLSGLSTSIGKRTGSGSGIGSGVLNIEHHYPHLRKTNDFGSVNSRYKVDTNGKD